MIRWVKSRKLQLLRDIDAGSETPSSLFDKHGVSEEEISEWRSNIDRHGEASLRVTHASRYRRRK